MDHLRRFVKFCSNNPLVAGVLGIVIGEWLLKSAPDEFTRMLAWAGRAGRWLLQPITFQLPPLTIVFGLVLAAISAATAAWFSRVQQEKTASELAAAAAREIERLKRNIPNAPTANAPALPPPDIEVDNLTAAGLDVLLGAYARHVELADVWHAMCRRDARLTEMIAGKATVAHGFEQLAEKGIVGTNHQGTQLKFYYLTEPGRDWVLERLTVARDSAARRRQGS